MPATIRAIVFKTLEFKNTKAFFTDVLKMPIQESSGCHFVIHTKHIRVVFMAAQGDFEVELYLTEQPAASQILPLQTAGLKNFKAPNGINVIITNQ